MLLAMAFLPTWNIWIAFLWRGLVFKLLIPCTESYTFSSHHSSYYVSKHIVPVSCCWSQYPVVLGELTSGSFFFLEGFDFFPLGGALWIKSIAVVTKCEGSLCIPAVSLWIFGFLVSNPLTSHNSLYLMLLYLRLFKIQFFLLLLYCHIENIIKMAFENLFILTGATHYLATANGDWNPLFSSFDSKKRHVNCRKFPGL